MNKLPANGTKIGGMASFDDKYRAPSTCRSSTGLTSNSPAAPGAETQLSGQ